MGASGISSEQLDLFFSHSKFTHIGRNSAIYTGAGGFVTFWRPSPFLQQSIQDYNMNTRYGTIQWFENMFAASDDDPWGHNWRGSQLYRYDLYKVIINEYVFNEVEIDNQSKILDIGCAIGDFTAQLSRFSRNITGIDISEEAIQRAKRRFPNIKFKVGALPETGLLHNFFDVITCLEVLNYMDEDDQKSSLCEIHNLLRNGGRVLFSSVIGAKPYFQPEEFVDLLSGYFEIENVEYYHTKAYSCVENVFLKIQQIQRLLTLSNWEFEKWCENKDKNRVKIVKQIRHSVIKSKYLRFITETSLRIVNRIIRITFGWKIPVKVIHLLSKKLSIGRTQIFVLAKRK